MGKIIRICELVSFYPRLTLRWFEHDGDVILVIPFNDIVECQTRAQLQLHGFSDNNEHVIFHTFTRHHNELVTLITP